MDKKPSTSQDQHLFQIFFEQAAYPCCMMQPDGIIFKVNPAFLAVFVNNSLSFQSIDLVHLVGYDYKTKVKEAIRTMREGRPVRITMLLLCKTSSSETIWMQWSFSKIATTDTIMVTAYDVSKQVMATKMLKESQRRFNEFIQHTTDLVFFCDKRLTIRKINREVEQTLGYSEDFMLGKDFSYFVYAEDRLLFSEFYDLSIHNQVISRIIRIIDAANNIRILNLRLLKSYSIHNQSEITINALDITDIVHLDEEVQQYRYFEELSEFKHEFLSNISNELRSPMNSIMGFNDMLLHSNPHPQQLDSILSVKNASLKLMQVIQDIIDFTAVKTGELHIKNNHFKLREILDRVQSVSQAHALHKDLQFTFDYPHDLPEFVLGDTVRFSQILLNLIGNALNITEKGQVMVAVDQMDSGRQEFCSLLINIYYEGSILPKNQNRLSFLETSETLKEQADFGFSSTKGLIEMLGGSLSFESKDPQKGNFDIRLSFKIGEKPREDEDLMINTLTGIKILLVEDSLLNQKLAQKMLQKLNADITLANNGQVALNYLQKERFDLILLDLQMPVMDGFTTIRNIRQNLELDTPVIAVTGLSQHDEKERCLSAGMNDYLSKPYKKEDLFRKLHKFLANK